MEGGLAVRLLLCAVGQMAASAWGQSQVCIPPNWRPPVPSRVLILRPRVTIFRDRLFSTSESEGTSDAARDGLHAVISQTFEDRGFVLLRGPAFMEEWETKPANNEAANAINDEYDSQVSPLSPPD